MPVVPVSAMAVVFAFVGGDTKGTFGGLKLLLTDSCTGMQQSCAMKGAFSI
jgi:hypothetical protein